MIVLDRIPAIGRRKAHYYGTEMIERGTNVTVIGSPDRELSADYPSTDYVGGTQWWCHYFDGKEWPRELHAEDTLIPTEKDDGQ